LIALLHFSLSSYKRQLAPKLQTLKRKQVSA
jgi:hypothetical protein